MAGPEKAGATRPYASPRRAAQAARTRAAVIAAARRLFDEHGFAATTVTAISAAAGVSPQTVYASFGSKPALVRAILQELEESAEATQWRARIDAEREPHRILAAFAQWTRVFFEANGPSFTLAQEAGADLLDLAEQGDRHRRQALDALVRRLEAMGALRPDLPVAEAVDRAWLVTGIQLYVQATAGCGWTPQAYGDWLAQTLAAQILPPQSPPPTTLP